MPVENFLCIIKELKLLGTVHKPKLANQKPAIGYALFRVSKNYNKFLNCSWKHLKQFQWPSLSSANYLHTCCFNLFTIHLAIILLNFNWKIKHAKL